MAISMFAVAVGRRFVFHGNITGDKTCRSARNIRWIIEYHFRIQPAEWHFHRISGDAENKRRNGDSQDQELFTPAMRRQLKLLCRRLFPSSMMALKENHWNLCYNY